MVKIYISGPITSDPDNYKEHFEKAAKRIEMLGCIPVNPALNKADSYKEYMDIALRQLSACDKIFMLDGWEYSSGARLERHYAEAVGMEIGYET